jgi:hypothetical protein
MDFLLQQNMLYFSKKNNQQRNKPLNPKPFFFSIIFISSDVGIVIDEVSILSES